MLRAVLLALAILARSHAAEQAPQPKRVPELKAVANPPAKIIVTPAIQPVPSPMPSVLPGPITLSADRFLFLSVPSYTGEITWDVAGGEAVSVFSLKSGVSFPAKMQGVDDFAMVTVPDSKSDVLTIGGKTAGTVTFTAWGVADGKAVKLDTQVIAVGGAVPSPSPHPTPAPAVQSGAFVAVIADESNPTVAQGQVIDGPSLRALKSAGKCRIYGSITEADKISAKKYDALMADAKLTGSALLILDADGKKVYAGPLPATDAALAAILKGNMKP
jgi:hypothetical protein